MAYALECQKISKTFGGLDALTDINLKVPEGEILGIIGPNGAGKTTLFNIISGALSPTRGEVIFKGQEISGMGAPKICRLGIARTYQLVRPFHSLTVLENVLVGLCFGQSDPPPRKARVAEAMDILKFMGLDDKENKVSGSLTLVEKKHLEIARALATRPDILLLDEVVSGLTPTEMTRTIDTIRQIQHRGVTVIMIEHVLRVVMELCKRIVVLNYGIQIAEGRPKEVVNDPEVIVAYLGKLESEDQEQEKWGD